jgi:hypothetical protein
LKTSFSTFITNAVSLTPLTRTLFGLFELNEAGTVLYSRIESAEGKRESTVDLTGRNFFKEVEPFANGEEMRVKIATFTSGTKIADSFRSTFHLDNGPVPVKILLARIRERSNGNGTKSVMVHIKKVTDSQM